MNKNKTASEIAQAVISKTNKKEKKTASENSVETRIKKNLQGLGGCWWFKPAPAMPKGYGRTGIPDLVVCYFGKFFAFEVKASGKVPSATQKKEIAGIKKAGGVAMVVYSWEEVWETLKGSH